MNPPSPSIAHRLARLFKPARPGGSAGIPGETQGGRQTAPRPSRAPIFEPLEPRMLLSAAPAMASPEPTYDDAPRAAVLAPITTPDRLESETGPGNDIYQNAVDLGVVTRDRRIDFLNITADDFDWFKFTLVDQGDFSSAIILEHTVTGDSDDLDMNFYADPTTGPNRSATLENSDPVIGMSFLNPGTYFVRVQGHPNTDPNAEPNTNTYNLRVTAPVASRARPMHGDFNDDGYADTVWRNQETGKNTLLLLDGTDKLEWVGLPTVTTDWTLGGTGDFDNNGSEDLVFRNTTNGKNTIMLLDGTERIGWAALPTVTTAWTLGGVGDMNQDGNLDLVFRKQSNGQNTTMLLDGTERTGWMGLPTVTPDWTLVGVNDANANNTDDVIFHNPATGEVTALLISGQGQQTAWMALDTVDTRFDVLGASDFDFDNQSDLLIRDRSTNETRLLMSSNLYGGTTFSLPTVTSAWKPTV